MAIPYLDIRRLRYFEAIATAGSLSAAARALNVAQPALTHQISELERGIGRLVFKRTSRGIELTRTGSLLLEHARKILIDVESAEIALRDLPDDDEPLSLRFGMSPSISVLSAALIRNFAIHLPHINLKIAEVRARHIDHLVSTGELDVAVTVASPVLKGALPLAAEDFYLVSAGPGLWPPTTIQFKDLAKVPNLIHGAKESRFRRVVDDALRAQGLTLAVALEMDGFNSRKQAVMEGLGSTILPLRTVAKECQAGSLKAERIVEPSLGRQLILYQRSGLDPNLVEQIFDVLKPIFKDELFLFPTDQE